MISLYITTIWEKMASFFFKAGGPEISQFFPFELIRTEFST
jgi:hypothetical protein